MSGDTFLCMTSVKKMRQASEATSHFQRGKAKMPRGAQALNESPKRRLVDYSHSFINSSPISQLNNRITAKKILQDYLAGFFISKYRCYKCVICYTWFVIEMLIHLPIRPRIVFVRPKSLFYISQSCFFKNRKHVLCYTFVSRKITMFSYENYWNRK